MFTGIVEIQGLVYARVIRGDDLSLEVDVAGFEQTAIKVGDSISVSGVCLTAVRVKGTRLGFDISTETLERTRLGQLVKGDKVNLELAMPADGRFGGHLVTGHVDGSGDFESQEVAARSVEMTFRCDRALAPYVVEKGSVCVDGVSLTVNRVIDEENSFQFEVNVIPHTLAITTLGTLKTGDKVHIEVDLIARYLKRLHDCNDGGQKRC
jgi:riboflavin synthase